MTELVPSTWKTDHLFVLVGGNPLPNYVAGRILLVGGGCLHLVHSPATSVVARRIALHFPNIQTHEVTDPADAAEIERVLRKALDLCKIGTVGLHYTGGTKAMAVHAHRICRNILASQHRAGVFTYLDAATLSLHRDDHAEAIPIQYVARLNLTMLFQLHGIELKREPQTELLLPVLDQALAKAHLTSEGQNAYDDWCQRYLRHARNRTSEYQCRDTIDKVLLGFLESISEQECTQVRQRLSEYASYDAIQMEFRASRCCESTPVNKLRDLPVSPIPLPGHPLLSGVAEAMRAAFHLTHDAIIPEELFADEHVPFDGIGSLTSYLDGRWVEHLAFAAFIAVKDECRLHDWGMSLDTTTEPYDFEFDVAAMQGYQLFAVSCTRSSDRRLNKSKLFEAYVRAMQLGGEEAKVGLVCCDSDPKVLEKQVQRVWGIEDNSIRVFGPGDLPNLSFSFSKWLSTSGGNE